MILIVGIIIYALFSLHPIFGVLFLLLMIGDN